MTIIKQILVKIKQIWDIITFREMLYRFLKEVYRELKPLSFPYFRENIEYTSAYFFSRYVDIICQIVGHSTLLIIDWSLPMLLILQIWVYVAPDSPPSIIVKLIIQYLIKWGQSMGPAYFSSERSKGELTLDLSSDERYLNVEREKLIEKLASKGFELREKSDLLLEDNELELFSIIKEMEELVNSKELSAPEETLTAEELEQREEKKKRLFTLRNKLFKFLIAGVIFSVICGFFFNNNYPCPWFF